MEITVKELKEKEVYINHLPFTEEELKDGSQSRLKYAAQVWGKRMSKACEEINEKKERATLKYASEDPEKKVLYTDSFGNLQFSIENEQKKRDELKKLDEMVVSFDPYFFMDEERIATFDLFIVEQLRGYFFPSLTSNEHEQ